MTTRLITWAGLACLAVGPTALLGQALPTPVSAGGDAADQVAAAASDLSAVRWALLLDAPVLLLVPVANDIPLYEAGKSNDPGAIGLVDDDQHNLLFGAGFWACALTPLRVAVEPSPADASAPVTPASI